MTEQENSFEGSKISFSTNTVVEYDSEKELWAGHVSLFVRVSKSNQALLVENFESAIIYKDNIMELFSILPSELEVLIGQSELLLNEHSKEEVDLALSLLESQSGDAPVN